MSALLRVAWPQLDVAPPDQRWLSGGVRRRAAHQRTAVGSGAPVGAHSHLRRELFAVSELGPLPALSTPEAARPRGSERAPSAAFRP